jgi:outer membrane biosynthesis protein TonB
MDAVRKWRYSPYLLNGKPIQRQTRITISFIAPE